MQRNKFNFRFKKSEKVATKHPLPTSGKEIKPQDPFSSKSSKIPPHQINNSVQDFDEFFEEYENEQKKERKIKKSLNSKRLSKSSKYNSLRVSEVPETTQSVTNITIHEDNDTTPNYRLPEIGKVTLSQETLETLENMNNSEKSTSLLVECFKEVVGSYEEAMFVKGADNETNKINEEMYTLSKIFFNLLVDNYAHLFIEEYDKLMLQKKEEEDSKVALRPNLTDLKELGTSKVL